MKNEILIGTLILVLSSCKISSQNVEQEQERNDKQETNFSNSPATVDEPFALEKLPVEHLNPPKNASRTDSGATYIVLRRATTNKKPTQYDAVTVHYTIWNEDGELFDSTRKRDMPVSLTPYRLIGPWAEALLSMSEGERRLFWVPYEIGKKLAPRIPSNRIVLDVELVAVKEGHEPPGLPTQFARSVADAQTTRTGIAYKMTKLGVKNRKPQEDDRVEIDYSVWNSQGRLLKSTALGNRTESFKLKSVKMKAWKEAIALLKEGDAANFWIPNKLLEEKDRSSHGEMGLIFHIELKKII